ncbi:hypothetical protein OKA06_08640 [Novosphingobium sp. MW5]|nr:hypothetical protein [Novosphingobium sp. MW5]
MQGKSLLLATGLGLLAQPALADDIVVKGKALSKEQAREQAQAFVQNIGIVTTVKPAARWVDPICPKAVGIVDDKAAMVTSRIRQVAANIGARVAKEGCKPNILITFTELGTDLIQRINSMDPRQLSEVPHSQRERLLTGNDPVRWWYSSQVRSHDGMPGMGAPPPWMNMSNEGGGGGGTESTSGASSNVTGTFTNSYRTSVVATQTKRSIDLATVVVDVKLAEGKQFDAVIDYAAMVTLAEVWPQGPMPGDSILSLFEGRPAPGEITPQDEALLKALYKMPMDREGRYHRGRLVKDVSSALATSK